MIEPEKCQISVIPKESSGGVLVALVGFTQDGTKFRGFQIKSGPYGLYLEPPKIRTGKGWITTYFDEDKTRFKALQDKVIQQYEQIKCKEGAWDKNDIAEVMDLMEPEPPFL